MTPRHKKYLTTNNATKFCFWKRADFWVLFHVEFGITHFCIQWEARTTLEGRAYLTS